MSRNDEKELLIRFVFVAPLTLLFLVKENFRKLGYSSYLTRWFSQQSTSNGHTVYTAPNFYTLVLKFCSNNYTVGIGQ